MIYNKKLVAQPPRTTAELVQVAKKLTDKGSGRFGLAYPYSDFYYHAALMNGFGGKVFDRARKPTLDAPENVRALDLLLRWQKQDGILPAEPSTALVKSLFNEGKAAIVFSGPWFLGEIARGIDYGLAPLPTLSEAGNKPMRPWMTVEGMYVAAPSKNKDAAFALIEYVTDTAAARVMALEGRQTPANKNVYADPKVASDPVLKAFFEQVKVAIPMPNVPEMTMVWSPATTAMNTVVKGTAKPKDAMDGAQKAVLADVARLRGQR
jgi:arabinogalactan oligomer/maltooligosaccharide transport system substrate-binding protein